MRILVSGATGFIGKPLCNELFRQGQSVRAAVRIANKPIENIEAASIGEIDGQTDWMKTLADISVVIHLAARVHMTTETSLDSIEHYRRVNVEGTLNLARQALQAGVKRFIYLSSVKVNGEYTSLGKPFRADDAPAPIDAYGISKREAEDGLRTLCANSGMDFVIIRPPLVYGPGVKGNFLNLLRWLDKGIPLPLASIRNKRSLIAVDNLIDLIITCINHPLAANQTFLASDDEDLSTPELLIRAAAELGKRANLLHLSVEVLDFVGCCLGKTNVIQKLCCSLQLDIGKTREMLGWQPPVSVDQALHATAQHYLRTRK